MWLKCLPCLKDVLVGFKGERWRTNNPGSGMIAWDNFEMNVCSCHVLKPHGDIPKLIWVGGIGFSCHTVELARKRYIIYSCVLLLTARIMSKAHACQGHGGPMPSFDQDVHGKGIELYFSEARGKFDLVRIHQGISRADVQPIRHWS